MSQQGVCGSARMPVTPPYKQGYTKGAPSSNDGGAPSNNDWASKGARCPLLSQHLLLETDLSLKSGFFKALLEEGQETTSICTVYNAVVVGQ